MVRIKIGNINNDMINTNLVFWADRIAQKEGERVEEMSVRFWMSTVGEKDKV